MKISRRQFFKFGAAGVGAGAVAGLGGIAYGKWESGRLVTTFKEIGGLGLKRRVRILHLSDFHASASVPWSLIQESVEIGMSHSPDVVVITGDWMTRTDYDLSPYTKCLEALRGHPLCFGSFGNHDGKYWNPHRKVSAAQALELQLKELGIRFLVNDSQVVRVQDSVLRIVGLGDLWKHETRPERCMSSMEAKDMPTLLLSHNPDSKSEVRDYGWDVMFSGHTHGGQLKIPIVNWRPILPVEDKSMVEGIYAWENRHIHITRGVGCLHGMRINCPPEVSLVDLS